MTEHETAYREAWLAWYTRQTDDPREPKNADYGVAPNDGLRIRLNVLCELGAAYRIPDCEACANDLRQSLNLARASFAKAGQRWLDGPACTDCGRKLRGR